MKRISALLATAVAIVGLSLGVNSACAQGTAFTYQGRLTLGGAPANGNWDIAFTLYDAASGGSPVGSALTNAVAVNDGLFTTTLDFGSQFSGANRWLELAARTNGGGAFATVNPRQQITPTPYAVYSANAGSATTATTAASANSVAAANITGTIGLAQLPTSIVTNGASGVNISGTFSGNGAGMTNVDVLSLNSRGAISFTTNGGTLVLASSLSAYANPNAVIAADINGDGKLDLISADSGANWIRVLTNNGSGGFVSAFTNFVSASPRSVVAADVNGDGKPDLICANFGANTLTVMTNNSSVSLVSFATALTINVPSGPQSVVATDVNLDGKPDLICASYIANAITVLTNGSSVSLVSFVSVSTNSSVGTPHSIVAADVNSDGYPDVISAHVANGLRVFTNNHSGSLGLYAAVTAGTDPRSVAVADVNQDGKLDVICANSGGNSITIVTNNGTGFGAYPSLVSANGVSSGPWSVAAADINGDGRPDVICASTNANSVTIFTNTGSGFVSASTNSVGSGPVSVVAADVNADGRPDVISANFTANTLSVLINNANFASGVTANFAGNLVGNVIGDGGGLTNVPGTLTPQNVAGTSLTALPNTVYNLTNDSQTTVTLPTSADVGDIVQVNGAGAGGWLVSGTNILGDYPSGAALWTPRASSQAWSAVASSAEGDKLVAVANGGAIYTSTDYGLSWSPRALTTNWTVVASSSDGAKLVAGATGGWIYTSTNSGLNWDSKFGPATWSALASSADGKKLVTAYNPGNLYTSTDSGTNWLQRLGSASYTGIASSSDGSKLIAVVPSTAPTVSTNSGTNWFTPSGPVQNWTAVAISADAGKLVAVANGGGIWVSNGGAVWIQRVSGAQNWSSVAMSADGTKLLAAATGSGQIWVSMNGGTNWITQTNNNFFSGSSTQAWEGVACSADFTKLVAVASGGQIYTYVPIYGAQGTSQQFQYRGGGVWQALSPVSPGNIPASSANSPNTLVKRDASGNFSAGVVTATLSGNATTATLATNAITATNALNVGGVSAASVASGANLANAATSANTVNAIVKRDATGDFSAGDITASSFTGNGSGLTSLNAAQLTSGTVSDTLLSANIPRLDGTNVFTGTNYFAGVTVATNAGNQFVGVFSGNGSGLTSLNAAQLGSGTVSDPRLSANIPRLDGTNVFTGTNRFAGVTVATNTGNQFVGIFSGDGSGLTNLIVTNSTSSGAFAGSFTGNGGGLTNLDASKITTGTLADARLSANVALLNRSVQSFTGGTNNFIGKVGVGTTTLHGKLTVASPSADGTGSVTNGLVFVDTTSGEPAWTHAGIWSDGSSGFNGSLVFGTDGDSANNSNVQERMRITSIGNVGIGTTNPAYALDISRNSASPVDSAAIRIATLSGNTLGPNLRLQHNGTGGRNYGIWSTGSGNVGGAGLLQFYDESAGGGSRMVIDASGNVGIGTTTPAASLNIFKSYASGTDAFRISFNDSLDYWMGIQSYVASGGSVGYKFRVVNGSGTPVEALAITAAGIGIGITNPAAKLQVAGDVKLGSSGQYFAASSDENLRVLRGTITGSSGAIIAGSGFTVSRLGLGSYRITFSTAFTSAPSVTVSPATFCTASVFNIGTTSFDVFTQTGSSTWVDANFTFIAAGPR